LPCVDSDEDIGVYSATLCGHVNDDSRVQEYFAEQLARCNVGEDCPVFDGLYNFCSKYAGGSIGGAVMLNWARNDIVINWAGGLHHGKRSEVRALSPLLSLVSQPSATLSELDELP